MKDVGTRIIVLEKGANPSRPGTLQFSSGDIRTLTDAPSRKTMLSEKSETDRTSTANMNSRQKKSRLAVASSGIGSRKLLYFASLLSAMSDGPYGARVRRQRFRIGRL